MGRVMAAGIERPKRQATAAAHNRFEVRAQRLVRFSVTHGSCRLSGSRKFTPSV